MTITFNDREAELSYAYLHAVASHCGFSCSYSNRLEDGRGIDARVGASVKPDPNSILEDFDIEVQLKSTINDLIIKDNKIAYPFHGIKQYNKLRSENNGGSKFLFVMLLPKDSEDWLSISNEQLTLKKAVYWISLRGAPETQNETSQTIYIPTCNILDVQGLKNLMIKVSKMEIIKYEL
jgi:hypothetical protein